MVDLSETDIHERVRRVEDHLFHPISSTPERTFENPPRTVLVAEQGDLPDPQGGFHPLEDDTKYHFIAEVQSPYGLEKGENTALSCENMSRDRFVYLGTGAAIKTRGVPFMATNFVAVAPSGTMLDLEADNTTEFYFETGNLIQMQSIGRIDGYRVPALKNVNIEAFTSGLTIEGSPDKVFFDTCPFRTVTDAGVSIVTLASTLDANIVKFIGDYIKDVQNDTVVVDIEAGGMPTEYFKYINVDHDSTVNIDSIFSGFSKGDPGVRVVNSYPLENSTTHGELDIDGQSTVAGSGAGPTLVGGGNVSQPFTLYNPERVAEGATAGTIEYTGKRNRNLSVSAKATVTGSNTSFNIFVGYNGTELTRSRTPGFLSNASEATGEQASATVTVSQGDTFSIYIENSGGTQDLDAVTTTLEVTTA